MVLAALAATAQASPATQLGEAYRAYDAGDLAAAKKLVGKLDDKALATRDYALWLRGMIELRGGDPDAAKKTFVQLGKLGGHLAQEVPWRLADCAWARGDRAKAASAYRKLVAAKAADTIGDVGTAMFRIAQASGAAADYRAMIIAHPGHDLAPRAEAKLAELGAPPLTAGERIERAKHLTDEHLWDEAVAEISLISPDAGESGDRAKAPSGGDIANQRDYWLGITLFKMRRRYADAADLLLGVAPKLDSAEALFHGARAKSRADRDDEAIASYVRVVKLYPSTIYAQEAQFLAGWLEFNRGNYAKAIPPLEESLRRYPKSKFAEDALWFLGMSHYFLSHWDKARTQLEALSRRGGALEGGKGSYWLARIDERLGRKPDATAGYTETVAKHPFSWYALLARSRLKGLGVEVTPFGGDAHARGPKLAESVDEALASDELIKRADELIAAGLGTDAGDELAREEHAFLKRHDKAAAFAMLLDRYRKAGNYNRPWMLAVSYSGNALDGAPEADAQRWWENAYPRAYQQLVEKYQALGKNPEGYLYSIMRKESGFDPHDLSYADAQGLLQMIPPTTQRVAKVLGVPYDPGRLYEPAYNVQAGSWYIGHLLEKFKGQIPIGAGSFNSGPRPVMKWLDQNGDRDMDELVELVPYTQTREYMKKVTENFARYRYLYAHEVYEQPLTVDKHYVQDQLIY